MIDSSKLKEPSKIPTAKIRRELLGYCRKSILLLDKQWENGACNNHASKDRNRVLHRSYVKLMWEILLGRTPTVAEIPTNEEGKLKFPTDIA